MLRALARAVLALLDKQAAYFKWKDHALLDECKAAERAMRKRCQAILRPAPHPELFQGS
jgi:hypothetical protein